MNIQSKIEYSKNDNEYSKDIDSDKYFKVKLIEDITDHGINLLDKDEFRKAFNYNINFVCENPHDISVLYQNIKNYVEKYANIKNKKTLSYEPLLQTPLNVNKRITINITKTGRESENNNNLKVIQRVLNSCITNNTNSEFFPMTVLYQHNNSQDNDSVYRIFNNKLLMNGFYSKSINYPEGIYRIIPQHILNASIVQDSLDNINASIMLNNQLNFGYFLNCSIFNHKGILERPDKHSIAYNKFVSLIEKDLSKKSILETFEDEQKEQIIYKTSELSRVKSDEKLQIALRLVCDKLGFRNSDITITKIAKRQLKLAYSQKLLYSSNQHQLLASFDNKSSNQHSNKPNKSTHKNKPKKTNNKNKLKGGAFNSQSINTQRTIEVYEQMVDNKYIKTAFWNSCCGECTDKIDKVLSIETIQLQQRVNNGLDVIKNITDSLSELWIASFSKEYSNFEGMLFQIMNSIVVELFDLKRILNNNTNLENLKMNDELIALIKEYGMLLKRIIDEGIYTSSKEGLKLISITESFISPVLSSFVTTNEFKDIHFEVFYALDILLSDSNFTRILFKFLLCYYENYSAADSIYRLNCRLTQTFPYKSSTIKKLANNKYNFKAFIKEIQPDSYQWANCIDVANIYLLSPFSILAQICTSKKALVYRCLKMINILNTENKVPAITYMNNIWKTNIINMPWTNFQILNKKILEAESKGNSRVNEIMMTDLNGESIKNNIEEFIKSYISFDKDNIETSIERKLLNSISRIYDKDYYYIYFNRSLNEVDSIDDIRIPFNDIRFTKYGFMFCSSNIQQRPIMENPICYHYSMIPEFEMEVIGSSDGLFIKNNRHPVYYKFPYLTIYNISNRIFIHISITGKANQSPNDDFSIELKEPIDINPYIELCGNNIRTNIKPIMAYVVDG